MSSLTKVALGPPKRVSTFLTVPNSVPSLVGTRLSDSRKTAVLRTTVFYQRTATQAPVPVVVTRSNVTIDMKLLSSESERSSPACASSQDRVDEACRRVGGLRYEILPCPSLAAGQQRQQTNSTTCLSAWVRPHDRPTRRRCIPRLVWFRNILPGLETSRVNAGKISRRQITP